MKYCKGSANGNADGLSSRHISHISLPSKILEHIVYNKLLDCPLQFHSRGYYVSMPPPTGVSFFLQRKLVLVCFLICQNHLTLASSMHFLVLECPINHPPQHQCIASCEIKPEKGTTSVPSHPQISNGIRD